MTVRTGSYVKIEFPPTIGHDPFDNNSSSGYTSPIQDKTLSRNHLTAGRGRLDHAQLHQIPANAQRRHSFRPGADRTSIPSTLQKDFQFPFRAMCGKV
jgi:hypothetical protein